jgi:VanZ family protein
MAYKGSIVSIPSITDTEGLKSGQSRPSPRPSKAWRCIHVQSNFPHPFTVFWWALTLAWGVLIFHLSTQTFTPAFSQALLARALHFLHLQVSASTFGFLHALLRKLAHLTEYAIFALLLYGVPGEQSQFLWRPQRAVICILVAAAYSLTDEYHQLCIPGRHASLLDCALDTFGASLAMLVPYTRKRISLLKSTRAST